MSTGPGQVQPDFVFGFGDIGSNGVERWHRLAGQFEAALTSLLGLLDLEGASLDAHLAQVGIGFERLGYELLRESGLSRNKAKDASFVSQVAKIVDPVADLLPFSATEFPDLLRRTYIGVKHADKAQPDWRDMLLAYRQSVQVFRAWVAVRLGVDRDKLRNGLQWDRLTQHILQLQNG